MRAGPRLTCVVSAARRAGLLASSIPSQSLAVAASSCLDRLHSEITATPHRLQLAYATYPKHTTHSIFVSERALAPTRLPAAREPEVGGANYVAIMPRVVAQRREGEHCPSGGEGGQSVVASSEARARMSVGCKAVQQPVWWRRRRRVPGTAPPHFLTPELP